MIKSNVAEVSITRREPSGRREAVHAGNVIFYQSIIDFLRGMWSGSLTLTPTAATWPWRLPAGYSDPTKYGCGTDGSSSGFEAIVYPGRQIVLNTKDARRIRRYGSDSLVSTDVPVVIGGIGATLESGFDAGPYFDNHVVAHTDVPTRQIGPSYGHAPYSTVCTTAVGTAYITISSGSAGASAGRVLNGANVIRLEAVNADGSASPDRGTYFVRYYDIANTRLYLMNMDGTPFVAQATATLRASTGARMSYFNETGDTPAGTGTTTISGTYQAPWRDSFIMRIRPEKSGNTTPGYTVGTYWFSVRPWTGGDGLITTNYGDHAGLTDNRIKSYYGTTGAKSMGLRTGMSAGFVGGCPGIVFDLTNQRMWSIATNGTNGNIFWWRYKTPETFREVATSTGTPSYPIAGITMTGATPRAIDIGTDNAVYVALYGGANAGWVRITSGLVASQILASAVGKGANCDGLAVDRSRARTVTGTITTAAGTGKQQVTVVGAAFTARDVGRVITIAGLANDNGTYRIASYIDATNITVEVATAGTAPNGGGNVTFVGVSAAGTMTVGDRIYLFWNDATSEGATTLSYMESLAWGTLLITAALTKTNGRTLYVGQRAGTAPPCAVDQKTGILFYASSDTTAQLNRFDPSGTVVNNKAISTYTMAGSGRGAGSGTVAAPTVINAIGCNPHASFNEVWCATDAGHIQLTAPDANLTAYERYYGSAATDYQAPTGYYRADGSSVSASGGINLRNFRSYAFGPDGRVFCYAQATSTTSGAIEPVQFNRSAGLWTTGTVCAGGVALNEGMTAQTTAPGFAGDGQGRYVTLSYTTTASDPLLILWSAEIHYQYVGGNWTAKEAVRGPLPDATSSPGLSCKDLHTTTDDLIWGVKIAFTPQGGATPHVREFIGVVGQTSAQQNDGATTLAANTFDGSGFAAADVGRYLRIESGADAGVYIVATYVSANRVTLKRMNGTAWTATATAGTLNYTKWEMSEDAYRGPECTSFYLADGFAKDNQQTIDNVVYELFLGRTTLSINAEAKKPCLAPLGAPGATGMVLYKEDFPRATNPNYNPGIPGHRALGAALTNGEQILDGAYEKLLVGSNGRIDARVLGGAWTFAGRNAAAAVTGMGLVADLGASVEVGSVVARLSTDQTPISYPSVLAYTNTTSGSICHLWKTDSPVASSAIRTSGVTNLSLANSTTLPLGTLSVSSGDLLGPLTTSNTDGTTTQNTGRFDATSAPFTAAHVGQVLKILGGTDAGSYRIISVDGAGAYCMVRALDQSTTSFDATAAGLSWEIRDAVREEDMIAVPSLAAGTHKIAIERLLTPTTAEVRISPTVALTNQSWECVKPSWDLVKRLSYSTIAQAPDVVNNGTYADIEGCDTDVYDGTSNATPTHKYVFDLSDLSSAQRTGRYWRLNLMSRFTTTAELWTNTHWVSFEFYDTSGVLIGVLNRVDSVSNPDFMALRASRIDFILGNDTDASHVAGVNGLVSIAAGGYTATLAGGNVWLGRQVRVAGANGSAAGGDATFTGHVNDPAFTTADIGRLLRIIAGPNAGYYRITNVVSATSLTVADPDGTATTLAADAGPTAYAIHEGPQVNSVTPDFLAVTTGGVSEANVEYQITGISADLKTLTLAEAPDAAITAQPWELRRRAVLTSGGVNPAYSARLVHAGTYYPMQSGDVAYDGSGTLTFWSEDVGGTFVRSDGQTVIGTGTFNGSGFTPDDVGGILVITSGADAGAYKIDSYTSPTQIGVVNAYTGAAVSFSVTSAANLTYVIKGERHYRAARYATVLRQ